MTTALVIVDIQNDYFPGGAHPLVQPEAAVTQAARLLHVFREESLPIVHIQHVWDAPDATFMIPGTVGVEIHDAVAPGPDETLLRKRHPNAFLDTALHDVLAAAGVDAVVVCGMMSNLCVDATARAASDLGYELTVAHDACAASDLAFDGREVPGADVHTAFMAALSDYGAVLSTASVVDRLS